MNRCELFPGWELTKRASDCGLPKGWGISRIMPNGRKRLYAVVIRDDDIGFAYHMLRRWARAHKLPGQAG